MYAEDGHNSLDDPPHAAMFNCETKPQSRSAHNHAAVMVSVIDKPSLPNKQFMRNEQHSPL